MARPNPLRSLMQSSLPSITEQRKRCYRPSKREVNKIYNLINRYIFNSKLKRPKLNLGQRRHCWGICSGLYEPSSTGAYCEISLSDKWFCIQWCITVLAHEMVHQYQWEVEGWHKLREGKYSIMNHSSSFYKWRKALARYDIPLHKQFPSYRWFQNQSFT